MAVVLRRVGVARTDPVHGSAVALRDLGGAIDDEARLLVVLVPEVHLGASEIVVSDSEKPRPSSRTKSRFARQPSPRTSRSESVISSRRTSILHRLLRCSAVTLSRGYHRSQMAIYLDHAATSPLRPQVLEDHAAVSA